MVTTVSRRPPTAARPPRPSSSGSQDGTTGQATTSTEPTGSTGELEPLGPKSLVIAIDGLRPDALEIAQTPAIDALIAGTWQPGYGAAYTAVAQCLTDAETWSGPNHWGIMTGAIGRQSGVTNNFDVASGDAQNFPHYLSILERTDDSLGTAYLFTWISNLDIPCEADFISHDDDQGNTARIVGILSGSFGEFGDLDTRWVEGTEPDAIFMFFDDVDAAGHATGFSPESPEYLAEIEEVDGQVGQIIDALAARPTFDLEQWQIVLTTDHGGTGPNHGGFSPEELTIPFLVVSQDVASGELPSGTEPGGTRNFDTVPTVLDHMGLETPPALTGVSRALGAL